MNRKINFPWWFIVVLLAAFAVGYLAWTSSLRDENIEYGMLNVGRTGLSTRHPSSDSLEPTGEYTGWKTYRNTEYGFSIEIPSDWTVEEDGYLWFSSPARKDIINEEVGFDIYVKNTPDSVPAIHTKTIIIGELKWTRVLSEGLGIDINYELRAGEKFYSFGTVDQEELLKKILSTFTFIE